MKSFQIKQKMWSWGGKFTITDHEGLPVYEVEGSFLQLPKSFVIRDMQGRVVSQIEKRIWSWMPRFDIQLQTGTLLTLRKEFTFFKPRYCIDNLGMTVQGDFWDMNFELWLDEQLVARISQEWLRLTSTYQVDVYHDDYTDLVISLVIAVDYVKEMEATASNVH